MLQIYELPEEAKGAVLEIVGMACNGGETETALGTYKTDDLKEALEILERHNMRKALQKNIGRELRLREQSLVEKKWIKNTWIVPYWWAVLSLFGKGKYNRDDEETKLLLDEIKPEWKDSMCGGKSCG